MFSEIHEVETAFGRFRMAHLLSPDGALGWYQNADGSWDHHDLDSPASPLRIPRGSTGPCSVEAACTPLVVPGGTSG